MSGYKATGYHEDSDADDEYERSVFMSPALHPDFAGSPTDSESPSTEHTPTTFSHREAPSPRGVITDWSAEQCADYVSNLGLPQYADAFVGAWQAANFLGWDRTKLIHRRGNHWGRTRSTVTLRLEGDGHRQHRPPPYYFERGVRHETKAECHYGAGTLHSIM
jgi:hypothetical protein